MSTLSKSTLRAQAKQRGRDNEVRTATLLGGYIYVGQAGDVVAGDVIVECKFRHQYTLKAGELIDWIAQAKANSAAWAKKKQPKDWIIEFYGGRGTERLVLLPLWKYKGMVDEIAYLRSQTTTAPSTKGVDSAPDRGT